MARDAGVGRGRGRRDGGVAGDAGIGVWPGRISKALPCAPRCVLLALDVSPNQIWVKDSLIPTEACHRQVQQAPTLLLFPNHSDKNTKGIPWWSSG